MKAFYIFLLFLSTVSYAGERDRVSFSLTPSVRGGILGIKEKSVSPLAYNGPLAGIGLSLSAQSAKACFFMDANAGHSWLGNRYRRDPGASFHEQAELSLGCMAGIYNKGFVSAKVGGALGFMESIFYNRFVNPYGLPMDASRYSLAFDVKTCFSAELKLPRRWSVSIEERIPFVAFVSPSIRATVYMPTGNSNYVWKAFPGNDLKAGLCRTLNGGNSLMLTLRHYCYSSGDTFSGGFRLQMLELGFAFRFGLNKRGHHESR